MKVRIKFSKEGPMKFLGHLDTMRYFQKALRRASLPVAFSGGYSPHMIMSFAAPLGVGIESLGEYFDLELTETLPTDEIVSRLDREMVEGVHILSARQVEDGKASKAMALVAAADYEITFRTGKEPKAVWQGQIAPFLAQEEILITKESKKGEKQVNIRPFIYRMELLPGNHCLLEETSAPGNSRAAGEGRQTENSGDRIFMCLASASANYTKPEAVMESFFRFLGEEPQEFAWMTKRLEVYANTGTEEAPKFVPLEALGEEVL